MRAIAVVLVAVALTGCVSFNYVKPHAPSPDEATVYLIRQSAQPYIWKLNVFLDQQKVAAVANRSYVVFQFPAGDHALHAEWPPLADEAKTDGTVSLKAGGTQYFVITGSVGDYKRRFKGYLPSTLKINETSQADGEALLKQLGR